MTGNESNIMALTKSGVVEPLLHCLNPTADAKLIEAAARTLNAIYASPKVSRQQLFMVNEGSQAIDAQYAIEEKTTENRFFLLVLGEPLACFGPASRLVQHQPQARPGVSCVSHGRACCLDPVEVL